MGFWGIEVKPGKTHYHCDKVHGKLHVTQATLGSGSSKEKSIIQCSVDQKSPIFLCSLIPNKVESCPLNLEFGEEDLVAFSVIGPQSIHLSGYFVANDGNVFRDDYESDSFGEDIAETDTEESSEYDSEDGYDDEFIDDDEDEYPELYPPSPISKSGVVIQEIEDDEKSTAADIQPRPVKKNKSSDSEDIKNCQHQIVLKRNVGDVVLESEDEDGFPISTKSKRKPSIQKLEPEPEQDDLSPGDVKELKEKDGDGASSLKRKVESNEQVDHMERKKKKKQKKKAKEGTPRGTGNTGNIGSEEQPKEVKGEGINQIPDGDGLDTKLLRQRDVTTQVDLVDGDNHLEERQKRKIKKKEKKSKKTEVGSNLDKQGDQSKSPLELKENKNKSKSSQVRTYANGLEIQEITMGKPDGKRASPGKQVSVHYIGKLTNGKIFDSNVGRAPFKFRLGVGQVIKGWDVGVNGMRVGDKRRLHIPPSMGYGAAGAGGKIPPNSWLVFEVELADVR